MTKTTSVSPISDVQSDINIGKFPPEFLWGVATSAFQIEGRDPTDGRGDCIWDEFCRRPGAIEDASNGNVACDHYHRWADDLQILGYLGVDTYRFSLSWPRLRPDGKSGWNSKGLAFYDKLIDNLLERGIKPYATLNHWDLPLALQQTGGWAARSTVAYFVEYAQGVAHHFGDRLASIATHNEPWVMSILGHETGIFAPGLRNRGTAMAVSHHLLLSHGLAMQAMRAQGCKSTMGIVLNLAPMHPVSNSDADRAKARLEDGRLLRWFADPLFRASYPQDVIDYLGPDAPPVKPGDMQAIAGKMDFLGVNYYSRSLVSADPNWDLKSTGCELTAMGWEVYPEGLTELLERLHHDYPIPPLLITENGAAFVDKMENGEVRDLQRQNYIARHIAAVQAAMRKGVPVAGYMVWSLLDNFEWASGYAKRFGIVHVDYQTLERTVKQSGIWYRDFLRKQKAGRIAVQRSAEAV